MLNFIQILNIKCFAKFELEPKPVNLIVGVNGTGKTTLLEAINAIRRFVVDGESADRLYTKRDLPPPDVRIDSEPLDEEWLEAPGGFRIPISSAIQRLAFASKINGESYLYVKWVQQKEIEGVSLQVGDVLVLNEEYVYLNKMFESKVTITTADGEEQSIPHGAPRSLLATLPDAENYKDINRFIDYIRNFHVFTPALQGISAQASAGASHLSPSWDNFTSWIQHHFLEKRDVIPPIEAYLQESIEGFQQMRLRGNGNSERTLEIQFQFGGADSYWLPLDRLSTGQIKLIVLYSITEILCRKGHTIFIDEPGTHLALREIQPWIVATRDKIEDRGGQLFIVSHNSQLLDYLAPDCGVQFVRDENGCVQAQPFEWTGAEVLTPSEEVARGWK